MAVATNAIALPSLIQKTIRAIDVPPSLAAAHWAAVATGP